MLPKFPARGSIPAPGSRPEPHASLSIFICLFMPLCITNHYMHSFPAPGSYLSLTLEYLNSHHASYHHHIITLPPLSARLMPEPHAGFSILDCFITLSSPPPQRQAHPSIFILFHLFTLYPLSLTLDHIHTCIFISFIILLLYYIVSFTTM